MASELSNELPDTRGCPFPDYMLNGDAVLKDKARWRGGQAPDYSAANRNFKEGRTVNWEAGSLPELVSNLVKCWEKEASYKAVAEEWRTIDLKQYRFSVNGGEERDVHEMMEIGTYNALIGDTALYSASHCDFEESHRVFRDAMPDGFAWECTEVYCGPPAVAFKWRHWGTFSGALRCPLGLNRDLTAPPTGEAIEIFGMAIAKLTPDFKIAKLEIFYDPDDLLKQMVKLGPVRLRRRASDKKLPTAHVAAEALEKLAVNDRVVNGKVGSEAGHDKKPDRAATLAKVDASTCSQDGAS